MSKNYIHNLETGKIELHFTKQEYLSLTAEQRADLKSNYLFSKYGSCWVSRSKNNHHWAIQTAEKLGFTNGGKKGERLSYAEELERKAERAENRAERYEGYSENAQNRGKAMQAEFNSHHGDIAFFTQPNINSSGGRAFTNRRNKILDRFQKGFEEYKKSAYFQERAETARKTADKAQLKNPIYLNNRIEECNKNIRQLEKSIVFFEDILYKKINNELVDSFYNNKTEEQIQTWLDESLDKLEYQIDKLAFFENAMSELKTTLEEHGRKMYSKEDLKSGYLFKNYRFNVWAKVERVNPKTVTATYIEHPLIGHNASCPYAEIKEVKIPEGWTEPKIENPFKIGDIVTRDYISGRGIVSAYQIIKVMNKTVLIQQIKVENNKPISDLFINDKQEKKTVKKDRSGNIVLNDGGWYLHRYIPNLLKN